MTGGDVRAVVPRALVGLEHLVLGRHRLEHRDEVLALRERLTSTRPCRIAAVAADVRRARSRPRARPWSRSRRTWPSRSLPPWSRSCACARKSRGDGAPRSRWIASSRPAANPRTFAIPDRIEDDAAAMDARPFAIVDSGAAWSEGEEGATASARGPRRDNDDDDDDDVDLELVVVQKLCEKMRRVVASTARGTHPSPTPRGWRRARARRGVTANRRKSPSAEREERETDIVPRERTPCRSECPRKNRVSFGSRASPCCHLIRGVPLPSRAVT